MTNVPSRRLFLFSTTASFATFCCGCGTLLHSERIGRPRSDDIDWKVAALNGLGLLLFVVPGAVAFAVDFYNGTIYLPAGHYGTNANSARQELVQVNVPKNELDRPRIEATIANRTGSNVDLSKGSYASVQLQSIDQFWTQERRLRERAS